MPLTVAPRTLPAVVSTIGEASAANAHRAESPPRSALAISEPPPISERRSKVRRFTAASRKFPEGSTILLFMTFLPLVVVLFEREPMDGGAKHSTASATGQSAFSNRG